MGHRHCNTEKLKFRVWILHVKAVLVIYVLNFYFYATPCKWRRQIVFVFCLFVSPAHIVFSSGSLSYKAFMTTSANENVTDFFPLMQILWLMKKKPQIYNMLLCIKDQTSAKIYKLFLYLNRNVPLDSAIMFSWQRVGLLSIKQASQDLPLLPIARACVAGEQLRKCFLALPIRKQYSVNVCIFLKNRDFYK